MPIQPDPHEPSSVSATVTRTFDAPRELVWSAWTQPDLFAEWFCTPPFKTPVSSVAMDVRPGGAWKATQVSEADGVELPFVGLYLEVVEPERLVLTFTNPEDPGDPNIEVATVTFTDLDGGTEMTLRQEGHMPAEQYPLLEEGYSRFFDQLAALLVRLRD